MILGFRPLLYIDHNWDFLVNKVETVAKQLIHTQSYRDSLLYEQGASQVAKLPDEQGWISKSGPSYDFFVMGGMLETDLLDQKFRETFPKFTFSPATICWSSQDIPEHKDNIKNGKCSIVYPLHTSDSQGIVYDPSGVKNFTYGFVKNEPVVINITIPHMVKITKPRIWFSIHTHDPIETVKEEFDKRKKIIM
jgi:hypothetical protein